MRKLLRQYRLAIFVAVAGIVAATALAVHDLGLFELDRNAIDQSGGEGGGTPPDDWDTLYAGSGSAAGFTGILGDIAAPGGQFQGGGSKDNNDISQWLWKAGEPLDKDDITNAYAAAYISTVDTGNNNVGDLIIYHGLDRLANNGSAQVGFWFFQNAIGLTNIPQSGGFLFSGVHRVGDVLVQSNFTQGGVISNISVFEWVGSGGSNGALNLVFSAADCMAVGSPNDDAACATVNQAGTPAPWPYTPKFGSAGTFPQGSFYEGGINITRLVPDAGCFTTFLAETRTSTPFDARLKDFAIGTFELCKIAVQKTGDALSKVGDAAEYTITIQNTGAITLWMQSIDDTLLGDLADATNPYVTSSDCGASLDPGESCTITAARTVLAGDPDPLVNTVTVVYDSKSDLTGDEITSSDDHSVNLFQPAVAADKTGDTLSKVGDEVNYTITLSNNSSADTPDMLCTASDTLLGTVFGPTAQLPLGDTVLPLKRTVLAGDKDPLVNEVTLSCTPRGFTNVFEASSSHTTDLFQPAIAVDKTGDTLSKVGDAVNYTITLSNNSSAGTPAMTCTATDSLLGTVFGPAVLPLGNTVVNRSRTVVQGDADPLVNTVTLTCSAEGFSNVFSASDSHSVNLFQPSITFDKTGDTVLSKVGDSVAYTITLNNTSSPDTPSLSCTITDTLLGINTTVNLASGASQVINKSRTVLAGDPDPLANTANVTCSPVGWPNVLTASDGHSVNLFQPAIAVNKTGDALSKVGDSVDYLFTLSNNSSADTPAMTCIASDTLLGTVFSGVLPLGNTVIPRSRTVAQGDPDPLPNIVTLTCGAAGFPNVFTASAGHSTNLFTPGVEVIKTGPDTATRGDTITYSFTINNKSSADAPNLLLNSVTDTVLGNLTAAANAAGCGTLAASASCNFTANYTTQATDPSPLVNVVTVHYHPEGFPNDITDNDDHQVTFPVQGCTPGFWQGGAGSQLWNSGPPDPDWTGAGTNPYIHTTLFNSFFNVVTDPRLDGLTMYDLVGSGGTSDSARRAARDMVAAYLNESAFPNDFPASSLAALTTAWYNAVAGGDAALDAFHNQVSAWNSPASPGFCPLP